MKIEQCKTCQFFDGPPIDSRDGDGGCVRFPSHTSHFGHEWCGEYRGDHDKMCWLQGPELHPAREGSPACSINGFIWPGIAARPASYRHCYREKGHEGEHHDYTTSWE